MIRPCHALRLLGQRETLPGEDLRLDIGWDRFEKLMLAVARARLGVHQVRFRRYGIVGQKQHGIDLAGRRPDRSYVVVQCKRRSRIRTFGKR